MSKLGIILITLISLTASAQKISGTYLWKTNGSQNDTIVSEIIIFDDLNIEQKEYSISKSIANTDYKSWPYKSRKAKLVKEKKFYKILQNDGDRILNNGLIKIKHKQIWFYGYRTNDFKLTRCKSLTHKKACV